MPVEPEDYIMPFGKHKGETLGDIADTDVLYLDWLNGLDNLRSPLKEAVEDMGKKYSREIDEALNDRENQYEH